MFNLFLAIARADFCVFKGNANSYQLERMSVVRNWMERNWQFVTTGISGILIIIGCIVGSEVGNFWTAVIFLSAFIIGGFEQAKEGIQATIKTKKTKCGIADDFSCHGCFDNRLLV